MHPPSSPPPPPSPSSRRPLGPGGPGLTRYGSAPGSLLAGAVDSFGDACFSGGDSSSLASESPRGSHIPPGGDLRRSRGLGEMAAAAAAEYAAACGLKGGEESGTSSSALVRQRSSPAGFCNHLTVDNVGFSVTRGNGSYSSLGDSSCGHAIARLKSRLSFTRQDSLSHVSDVSENVVDGVKSIGNHPMATHSYATSFGMDSWDSSNSIVFSSPPSKRAKSIDEDILNCLNALDGQFSLPQTTLEMATVEKLLNIPEDSVPCKIRAKRGCATHPRSIAERERRTRISGKLKKLQELVPNMDKQTSYADMLDLAVQHIKGLQSEIQKLQNELENCTCGCKPIT